MKYINTTPHKITVYATDRATVLFELPPDLSCQVRCSESRVLTNPEVLPGIPTFITRYGALEGLPPIGIQQAIEGGIVYIASMLAAKAARREGRLDVLYPGELLRNEKGEILGCVGLSIPE